MRYFIDIAYKGTHYHGWQVQPNALTIQGTIQMALEKVLKKPIALTGSGRTDAGVHAKQQWAHMDWVADLNIDQLQYRLNALLPYDIVINGIHPVKPGAHARFDALNRTYEYAVISNKDPFLKDTYYLLAHQLDVQIMNQAAAMLLGQTDFTTFSKISVPATHYRCSVMQAQWKVIHGGRLVFTIQANRFLRGMVRSIVGNLIQVGLCKLSIAQFKTFIERKDRSLGASLAPACGLTLTEVNYPADIFL
jgi:tRNA pseudouridine38-40 synthase